MEPAKLVESLKEWAAVTETLLELVPSATPRELLDYAGGVIASPVAASVLATAINGLASAVEPAPAVSPPRRKFGVK